MADRIPLIINSSANQIQELPSGDSLTGVTNIAATGTVTGNTIVGVGVVPIGCVIMWGGSPTSIPTGFLLCNGGALARAGTYAPLFAGIGTAYGEGDASSTFNIPNYVDRFPYGAGNGGSDPDPGDTKNLGATGTQTTGVAINFIIRVV